MAEGLIAAQASALLTGMTSGDTNNTYVQLHTGAPGAAGTLLVAVETDRQRVTTWGTASAGAIASGVALEWLSVAGTEDYTKFSMWSASTSGTCKFTGSVTSNPVTAGDTFTIPSGDLDVSFVTAS